MQTLPLMRRQAACVGDQQLHSALRHLNEERVANALLMATNLGAHTFQALHFACIVVRAHHTSKLAGQTRQVTGMMQEAA